MTNFVKEIQSAAMTNRTSPALTGGERTTFSQLWSLTDSFAGGLQNRDITAGDRVTIHLSTPRSFLIAIYGTLRAGCVPVTVPPEYDGRTVSHVLSETDSKAVVTETSPIMSLIVDSEALRVAVTVDSDARMGITFPSFLDNGGMNGSNSRTGIDVVRRSDDSPGLIAYVGQDEREPLAVVYTHDALQAAATAGSSIHGTAGDDGIETHLGATPLSNPVELMYGANATLIEGGEYRAVATPDVETIQPLLVTTDIDRAFVTPQQYRAVRASETSVDTRPLTVVESGTAPIEGRTVDSDDAVHLWGTPETGATHVRTPADVESDRLGRSLPDVRTRVSSGPDGDELAIGGPAVMDGYFERPDLTSETIETTEDGRWIRTGVPVQVRDETIFLETGSDVARPSSTLS